MSKTRIKIIAYVLEFFNNDVDKTCLWMNTKNPNLGNLTPNWMLAHGKEDKLLQFIEDSRMGD